jgi:hypothetical protein
MRCAGAAVLRSERLLALESPGLPLAVRLLGLRLADLLGAVDGHADSSLSLRKHRRTAERRARPAAIEQQTTDRPRIYFGTYRQEM